MGRGARGPWSPSLQRRLFGWLMLPLLLGLPLLGLALYKQVQYSAQMWLDDALEDVALTLAGQIDTRGDEPRIEISATMDRALRFDRQDDVFYLVLGPAGEVLQGDAGLVEPSTAMSSCGAAICGWCSSARTAARGSARCWWPRRSTSARPCRARSVAW